MILPYLGYNIKANRKYIGNLNGKCPARIRQQILPSGKTVQFKKI